MSGTPRERFRPPALTALFTLLFATAGWVAGLARLSDNSFLWHLRTGHLILDQGIPRADPYSFTVPGRAWVAQSWLAETLYALADDLAGGFGIRLLVAVTSATIGILLYRLALHIARDRLRAAGLCLAAFAAMFAVWSERPLLFGMLAALALVWVVEVEDSWVGRHPLVTVPVLMWLWANVHGSVALGFVYLGLHVLGRWSEGLPPWEGRERHLVVAAGGALLLMLANPYGLDLVLFPVRLLLRGEALRDVVEWESPDFQSPEGILFGLWLGVFTVIAARASRRPGRRDLVVALPFLALALWALRNIGIAPIVTLPVVARAVAAERDREANRSPLAWVAAASLVLLFGSLTASAAGEPDYEFRDYPVAAMKEVEARGWLGRRVLTTDAWSGYVIFRYWPRQPVFMDDRYDMFPQALIDDYTTVSRVEPGWEQVLADHGVEVVVWDKEGALAQALRGSPGWQPVHRDTTAVVFVRQAVAPGD